MICPLWAGEFGHEHYIISYLTYSMLTIRFKFHKNCLYTFLVIKNGVECKCFDEIPYQHVVLPRSPDEMKLCDITCAGAPDQVCGGANSYSAYIG